MRKAARKESPENVREMLKKYDFAASDFERCIKDGLTPDDVLTEVESLLDNHLATEGTVRDVFFNEMYSEMFASRQVLRFIPKPASIFEEQITEFLWYPYIPIGHYTALFAPGGTSKSYLGPAEKPHLERISTEQGVNYCQVVSNLWQIVLNMV